MSKLDDILLDGISAAFNSGEDYGASHNHLTDRHLIDQVDILTNRTAEELRELISTLLGESIRDTNNSDEAIAMFRTKVNDL